MGWELLVFEAGEGACGSSFYHLSTSVRVEYFNILYFIIFKNTFENVGEKDATTFLRAAKNECNVMCSWVEVIQGGRSRPVLGNGR